ncbi:MAG: hypothetical protein KDA75_04060 [Planctomycetaceae bacterium]|nr:hypothetical protein [Planctomycetaceae bacterium]
MAKLVGKGTLLKIDIASTLTTIAQVTSISDSGAGAETFDSTTLDTSGAGKEYDVTGYAEPGTLDFEIFYDPDAATHQAITDNITTPAVVAWSLTFTDSTPFVETFNAIVTGFGRTVAMNDGVKASVSLQRDGLAVYST